MSEGKYTKKYDPKSREWIVRRIRTMPKQKPSEAFLRNFDNIDWSRPNDDEAGPGGGAKKDSEEEDTRDDEQSDD